MVFEDDSAKAWKDDVVRGGARADDEAWKDDDGRTEEAWKDDEARTFGATGEDLSTPCRVCAAWLYESSGWVEPLRTPWNDEDPA